jgi:hypothetical protein
VAGGSVLVTTLGGGVTVTVAAADCVGWATEVAVTVTAKLLVTEEGAT